jgi:hypothetical protein
MTPAYRFQLALLVPIVKSGVTTLVARIGSLKVWDFTRDLPKFSVGVCPPRSGRVQGGAPVHVVSSLPTRTARRCFSRLGIRPISKGGILQSSPGSNSSGGGFPHTRTMLPTWLGSFPKIGSDSGAPSVIASSRRGLRAWLVILIAVPRPSLRTTEPVTASAIRKTRW